MRILAHVIVAAFALFDAARAQTIYNIEIVAEYPHDTRAFTQGLFFLDGSLYESTGMQGESSLRKVALKTGEVLKIERYADEIFGEGIAPFKDKIVAITWRSQLGFVFDRTSFKQVRQFTYPGEGWGITSDGKRLIMSDGTSALRFLDPRSLEETGRITVTHKGKPVDNLNELEWIDGEVYANVWRTDIIVRIDPESGAIVGVIDARPLRARLGGQAADEVLNGIAYDSRKRRLFLTGKYWPKLFEVKLVPRALPQ
ncbi:MAG: glutaminyl-peptide cyclotransferase [Amphiplicatus sp.]